MAILPNLVSFFSAYGSYHNNIVNKIIHLVCIPTIVFSLLGLLHHVTFHFDILSNNKLFEVNFQLIFVLLVTSCYMIIDLPSGVLIFVFHTKNYNYFRLLRIYYMFPFGLSIISSTIEP